jgi:ferric-dicitrate binding protein FerR (iron transport regulator)
LQDKHFISLAKKYANHTATESEKKQVEAFYDGMQEQHETIPINLSAIKKEKIKHAIDSIIHKKPNSFHFNKIAIAASILLLIGVTFFYSFLNSNVTTISTVKGERKEILLADGSHVFLNAKSSITYNNNFTDKRNISLSGEAFFKVARDTEKPFTITSNNTETKVLGTSFNINSTSRNKTIVSVNTGKVIVRSKTKLKDSIILTKNQQVEFINNKPLKLSYNNSDDLMAWTKNIIVLNNETLENTAEILENWYNISIDIENEKIKNETISGKFNNETLKNVMQSIALLKNLKITYLTPNHITIRRNLTEK